MQSFWNRLKKPFFVMAPMADVTDPAFRKVIAKYGKPDVTWTEFISADGLYHTRETREGGTTIYGSDLGNPLMRDLQFTEGERPIVAQIFSSKPEMITYATKLVAKLGFDGVDINMGCPDRGIEKQGCGAAMIKTPDVAKAVIQAAQKASNLPVSVKTRIGYNQESIDTWLPEILSLKPAALTVHLRTRKEMSLVPAHWDLMHKVVELRDRLSPETLLIGNGDVKDLEDARQKAETSGADGVMIGRGMFGNPWIFNEEHSRARASYDFTTKSAYASAQMKGGELEEKLAALVELAYEFEQLKPTKHFAILKKHIKAFVTGFDGAAAIRAKLMEAETASELESSIANFVRPHETGN